MSTITISSDYFKSSLLSLESKIANKTYRSYDNYQVCYHDDTKFINQHRINAAYRLRIDAAKCADNGEMVMLDKPIAVISIELEFREDKDSSNSSASKKKVFNVTLPDGTLEEQIDFALAVFKNVVIENQVPAIQLDFWRFVSDSMGKWDKSYESSLRAHQLTLSAAD